MSAGSHGAPVALQRRRLAVVQPAAAAHHAAVAQRAVAAHAPARRLPHVRAGRAEQLRPALRECLSLFLSLTHTHAHTHIYTY